MLLWVAIFVFCIYFLLPSHSKKKQHKRSMIGFDHKKKYYYVKGSNPVQKLRGLHKVLAKQFYPAGSTYENTRMRTFERKTKGSQGLQVSRKDLPKSDKQARKFGNKIDTQMQKLIEKAPNTTVLRQWVTHPDDPILLTMGEQKKPPKRPVRKLTDHAAAAIRCLLDNDWVPKQCQVHVGSAAHKVATSADVVCEHRYRCYPKTKEKEVAVVEIKTGYETTWESHTGQWLLKPLGELRDTPRHKAHLQALCTAVLYKHTMGMKHGEPKPFVLRVSRANGAKLEPLNAVMAANIPQIVSVLCAKPAGLVY